jgi:hypothetical protein
MSENTVVSFLNKYDLECQGRIMKKLDDDSYLIRYLVRPPKSFCRDYSPGIFEYWETPCQCTIPKNRILRNVHCVIYTGIMGRADRSYVVSQCEDQQHLTTGCIYVQRFFIPGTYQNIMQFVGSGKHKHLDRAQDGIIIPMTAPSFDSMVYKYREKGNVLSSYLRQKLFDPFISIALSKRPPSKEEGKRTRRHTNQSIGEALWTHIYRDFTLISQGGIHEHAARVINDPECYDIETRRQWIRLKAGFTTEFVASLLTKVYQFIADEQCVPAFVAYLLDVVIPTDIKKKERALDKKIDKDEGPDEDENQQDDEDAGSLDDFIDDHVSVLTETSNDRKLRIASELLGEDEAADKKRRERARKILREHKEQKKKQKTEGTVALLDDSDEDDEDDDDFDEDQSSEEETEEEEEEDEDASYNKSDDEDDAVEEESVTSEQAI